VTIDRLSGAGGWLSVLRAEAAKKSVRAADVRRSIDAPSAEAPNSDAARLRRDLQAIAQAVPLDDPAAVAEAQVRMVRAILQWEFGAQIREHPEWHAMVERIAATLQANENAQVQFEKLLRQLQQ
jgi:hypothetical protein